MEELNQLFQIAESISLIGMGTGALIMAIYIISKIILYKPSNALFELAIEIIKTSAIMSIYTWVIKIIAIRIGVI